MTRDKGGRAERGGGGGGGGGDVDCDPLESPWLDLPRKHGIKL